MELLKGERLDGHGNGDLLVALPLLDEGAHLELVVDDGDEILGELHVELDHIRAVRDRVLQGSNRVFSNIRATEKKGHLAKCENEHGSYFGL